MNPPAYPWPLNVIDRWCWYWPSSIWESLYPWQQQLLVTLAVACLVLGTLAVMWWMRRRK